MFFSCCIVMSFGIYCIHVAVWCLSTYVYPFTHNSMLLLLKMKTKEKKNLQTNGRQQRMTADILHILWYNTVLRCTTFSFCMHMNRKLLFSFEVQCICCIVVWLCLLFCTWNQLIFVSCWRVKFILKSTKVFNTLASNHMGFWHEQYT